MRLSLLIILLIFSFGVYLSIAHETNEYKHAKGTIGPAIGVMYCDIGSQVWWLDRNDDGEVDGCIHIIYTHEKMHVRELPLINGECSCPI